MDAASLYPMNINWRYYELEAFFAACAEHGFSSAELWLCPQHFLINAQYSEDPARLQALMGEYGVKLACICGEQNNPKPNNIAARGELLIANTRAYFERVIDLAALVGSPLVLVTPGWNYYDEPVEDARTRSASMLAHLADYAAPRGITLALESIWTVSSQVAPTIADIAALKDRVNRENLKLTLDFGAMGNAGETIGRWYEEWQEAFDNDPSANEDARFVLPNACETELTVTMNARELIALRPDGVRIYPTVIVRDTELYDLWQKGEYREHSVEDAVELCARLLPLFEAAQIPVIRLGLNPTEELSSGRAAAGAYHPALGELVKSRILLHRAEAALQAVPPGSHVRLGIAPKLLSQMIGQHGENRRKLIEAFSLASLDFVPREDCHSPRLLSRSQGGQTEKDRVY